MVIKPGAVLNGPLFIDKNSFIGTNSLIRPYSTIGKGVTVGFGVEIKNSIIYDKTQIGRLCFIGDSIIGERVEIGAGTQTVNIPFEEGSIKYEAQKEIIEIPILKFGTVSGDNVIFGTNVSIMPGRQIGPSSTIYPGITLYEDIPSSSIIKVNQNIIITEK